MNKDFREFFASLNAKGVNYLLIGGAAYNLHAPPRATKDIDIWVKADPQNLESLLEAIRAFGFPTEELTAGSLASSKKVLMLGRVPNRIDVLTAPAGVEWEDAWRRRVVVDYEGVPIGLLGIDDLIRCKEAVGRPRDLADVAMLRAIAARRRPPPADPDR